MTFPNRTQWEAVWSGQAFTLHALLIFIDQALSSSEMMASCQMTFQLCSSGHEPDRLAPANIQI